MKYSGTMVRGIKAPIIKQGDDIREVVIDSVNNCICEAAIELNDKDVIAITEAVVAKAQGNYATIDQIAQDVKNKFGNNTVGLILPILSRNRFSLLLKAIAQGAEKLIIQLSYPYDEVGNPLMNFEELEKQNINPYSDVLTYEEFRAIFPSTIHPFTQVDYVQYYKEIANCQIILANNPLAILKYCDSVLVASIHDRHYHKKLLLKNGAKIVYGLDDILSTSVLGSGYHPQYGLLGSNVAGNNRVKLFPRDCQKIVEEIQMKLFEKYHKKIEVMVYGDGAFKDPVAGIWELADPVVSPGFTSGLQGTPNELKFKFLADNMLNDLSPQRAQEEIKNIIKNKDQANKEMSLGTTPRRISDLLGSLADLVSGSGDKGTPIVLIQNYFTNYSQD